MAELLAKSPCAGLLPVTAGNMELDEHDLGPMTSVAPFRGREPAVAEALKSSFGLALPKPGRSAAKGGVSILWFGRAHLLLTGAPAPETLAGLAALTDQSDAWTVVQLKGDGADDVLARLVPIDLRIQRFRRGHTARTQIGHMQGAVTRLGADRFQLMVFRSMAATLVHEVKTAMEAVAARR